MKQTLMLSPCLLAVLCGACKGHDDKPAVPAKVVAAADPWAKQAAPKVDSAKDPDLAQMTELAKSGPGATEYPQADAVIA
ncbi:MAG: hypothetical protein ABI467_29845, partial [Kofleriaceae bacterium]